MKNGFSLIELIVVTVVTMVLVGIGAASINDFIQRSKVETVSNELSTQIKLARNMAITSQLPEGSSGLFNFVRVDITSDFTITAIAIKKDLTQNGTYFSKKIDSTSGLTVTPISFGFWTASGRLINVVDGSFMTETTNLTVTSTDGKTKIITVTNLGLVND